MSTKMTFVIVFFFQKKIEKIGKIEKKFEKKPEKILLDFEAAIRVLDRNN